MAVGVKLLYFARPFVRFLPEVSSDRKPTSFKAALFNNLYCVLIFLIFNQLPLYGIKKVGSDPFYWLRVIMASNSGTVMELGITPLVTAGMIIQLLACTKLINIDGAHREEQKLVNGAQKLISILLIIFQSVACVLSGMYGDINELGIGLSIVISAQLIFAGILLILLDEFQQGYGVGSGVSTFIATSICQSIIWKALSPKYTVGGRGREYEGAIIALFHLLITRTNKVRALKEAFYRQNYPNLTNLLATALVFLTVMYFQGFRVAIPVRNKNARGTQEQEHIELFYTSNMPVILQSALISNLYFISQLLFKRFGENAVVRLIGTWEANDFSQTGQLSPVSGLAYFVTPPSSLADIATHPFHVLFYLVFTLFACGMFSKTWLDISGKSAKDVANKLKSRQQVILGHRDTNLTRELNRYIPTAAAFGGMCIGALTVVADFMGAIGSGTGIVLAVTIIHKFVEDFRGHLQEMGWI